LLSQLTEWLNILRQWKSLTEIIQIWFT
jgi:hypothetical protein